ncbi:MAG: hypothetical protein P1R58_05185 [bacterium]|nr:hypothetical protein [bacterium]
MNRLQEGSAVEPYSLEILDDLINRYYRALMGQITKEPDKLKLGELLKMIELRVKQTPTDREKKQFWDMLESVRKEQLSETKGRQKTGRRSGSKSSAREKKS